MTVHALSDMSQLQTPNDEWCLSLLQSQTETPASEWSLYQGTLSLVPGMPGSNSDS